MSRFDPASLPLPARRRLYELAAAGCSLAVLHGLISGDEAAAWLLLVVPVLGIARRNVPKAPVQTAREHSVVLRMADGSVVDGKAIHAALLEQKRRGGGKPLGLG